MEVPQKSRLLLYILLLFLHCANLNLAGSESKLLDRSRRKVADVSSSVIDYMERLRNSLSDEDGRPTLSRPDDPTEVWGIQDRGKVK